MPYKDREKRLQYAHKWNKQHYLDNTKSEKARIYKRRKQISEWYANYKEGLHCKKCGESASICLDFHHLDPDKKDLNLASVKNWGYSIKRLITEIDKCIVLCSNCHRKLHANLITIK